MAFEIDSIDSQLLTLLQANARESTANLARKLDLARTTVVARISRLERKGIVTGYGIRLAEPWQQAGIQVFCGLKVNPKASSGVLRSLQKMHEVEEASAVSGSFDYIVCLRCATMEELDRTLDRLGQIEGISETHSSVVLSKKLDRRSNSGQSEERSTNAAGSSAALVGEHPANRTSMSSHRG